MDTKAQQRCKDEAQMQRYLELVKASSLQLPRYMLETPGGRPYLERFELSASRKKGEPGTYMHIIYASDEDRDPHDHPHDFDSQIIFGSYREEGFLRACEPCGLNWRDDRTTCGTCGGQLYAWQGCSSIFKPGDVNKKIAHELHRLTILEGPVVTLVTRGPKIREWGFQTPLGWEHNKPYIERKFPKSRAM